MIHPPYALLAIVDLVAIPVLWARWFGLSRKLPREERLRRLNLSDWHHLDSRQQNILYALFGLFVLLSLAAVGSLARPVTVAPAAETAHEGPIATAKDRIRRSYDPGHPFGAGGASW